MFFLFDKISYKIRITILQYYPTFEVETPIETRSDKILTHNIILGSFNKLI